MRFRLRPALVVPFALGLGLGLGLAAAPPAAAQPPCPPCPDPGGVDPGDPVDPEAGLAVFFGNLHAHTSYSDGEGEPREAYVHARDRGGLDFLVLSEHNHGQAGIIATQPQLYAGPGPEALVNIAAAVSQDGRFIALYGQEFSTISRGNHVNVIDAPTVIGVESGRFDLLLDDYLAENPDSTGRPPILVLNHPGGGPDNREYGRDDFGGDAEWVRRMGAVTAVINLINGPSHEDGRQALPSPREGSFRFFLNKGFRLAPSIDQDNHRRTWGTIHDGRTAVVAPALTKRALLDALRARHVYATTDRNLRVICRWQADGLCGDVLPAPAAGTDLALTLEIADDDEPAAAYQVRVFSDEIGGAALDFGDPIEEVMLDGDGRHTLPALRYLGGRAYYLVQITQFHEDDATAADADRAWLAPLWLEPPDTLDTPAAALAAAPGAAVDAVADARSEMFHAAACPLAAAIAPDHRLEGAEAAVGRRPHRSCAGEDGDER